MDTQIILDEIQLVAETATTPAPFEDALSIFPKFKKDHPFEARAYARTLRETAESKVGSCGTDLATARRFMSFIESILKLFASDDFDSYMLFMEWNREPEKQFYRPRRHVLIKVVHDLQDLHDGKLDFLSISMPPRVGKSTLCIFFLTFEMGNNPLAANLMTGHSDKLTKGFHVEALSIISDSYTYRFQEVFPDAVLVASSMADETINLMRKSRFPTLTCRSADGTLTGAVEVGKDALLYADDLVSDREEALSSERMDKLYQTYLNQLKDRMNDGAKQLFVATRWVPNDPIGRIEEQYEDNPRYRFTVMPALNENGESNFVYLHGLGFSTEYYEDMRESLVEAGEEDSWWAKYMGSPRYIGGLMFARENLRYYDKLPDREPDGTIAACDTKDKGKDYAALPIVEIYDNDYFLVDVVCDNSLPEVVEPKIADALIRNNVGIARFESNNVGGRIADDTKKACKLAGHSIDIRKKYSNENKETRILVDSMWIKEHVVFPKEIASQDMKRFMSMLTHYTTEGKNKHDDAPDSLSMLKRLATSMSATRVKAVKRPW